MIYKTLSAKMRAERRREELKAMLKALKALVVVAVAVVAMNYAIKLVAITLIVLQSIAGTYQL